MLRLCAKTAATLAALIAAVLASDMILVAATLAVAALRPHLVQKLLQSVGFNNDVIDASRAERRPERCGRVWAVVDGR